MKRKCLKTISAMALALTLSVAALAGTVQAAEGIERVCMNHHWEYGHDDDYTEINGLSHTHHITNYRYCTVCKIKQTLDERNVIEDHDLQDMTWPLRYKCRDCGYEERWDLM